ncbi:helicase-associated domain-containing protein [Longimicrobium sp.]|uniref:helicase-associated domain-containing protein n=1 Tax=Longimicrobium sp. TaxID=2029185 RepID=UPI002CD7C27E|nr:helicase-associated domain-containing protein [Longimicrobium sp.]HSU17480.1 helicase-associated domain-containing protein [Longimicrobium sp.]
MKLADIDWGAALEALPRWEALSRAARLAFLQIKPGAAAEPAVLGAAVDELVAAGFVTPPGPRGQLYPHAPELKPLLSALRAMDRVRPLDGLRGALSDAYLQDQLTHEETNALAGGQSTGYYGWSDRGAVAAMVSSVDWLNGFLATAPGSPLLAWERAHLPRSEQPRLFVPVVGEALRRLVRALAAHPAGVPLRSLAELLPDATPGQRAVALAAGLRYLLVFVSLREPGPDAVLGVLPAIVRRMGPPPSPPEPVEVTETFEAPFRVSDMTTVLVDAAAEPIPVRGNDGSLYVRSQKALASRLLRPPAWADAALAVVGAGDPDEDDSPALPPELAARIDLAMEALQGLRLAGVRSGERFTFTATTAGREWLALSEGERLKHVLDALRASPQRNPGWTPARLATIDFFGVRLPFGVDEAKPDLRAALAAAFLSAPADGMVRVDAFTRYHAELRNPFLGPDAAALRKRSSYSGAPRTREGWEGVWEELLDIFLRVRLVPLGGARLGRVGDDAAFALTDAGRYLLGATDELRLAAAVDGEVVVQPDFEIVFLSASPRLEAELARFAERTGTGVGALFRITQASVLRAAEQGVTADRMLKTLAGVSRAPVPANVARQVRDWFGGTRRVRIRPAVLVECPDMETAARVSALGGPQVSSVTRTLLRLDGDAKTVSTLVKKLRAKGIFVQE